MPTPPSASPRPTACPGLTEIVLIFAVMLLYYGTRGLAIGQEDVALANALALIDLERQLGLFHEPAFNAWVIAHPLALEALPGPRLNLRACLGELCQPLLAARQFIGDRQGRSARSAALASNSATFSCASILPACS